MQNQYQTLTIAPIGAHLVVVELNRPESANALNTQMGKELVGFFETIAMDAGSLRCVVLTGKGKVFCAGGDVKERSGMTDEAWNRQHLVFERMVRAILACPVPVVAAVNGAATGGGCEITAACDFVYAADTAFFRLPEVSLGIMPGGGGTQTLPRAMGERRALELILTARRFSAAEAFEWGLVNAVVPAAELREASISVAREIVANAPIAVRQAKQAIHHGMQMSLADGLCFEIEAYNRLVPTKDRREGIDAINQKRSPEFIGK